MARAIWKGVIALGDLHAPVKMYSAIEDRAVHFRLLHAKDLAPVVQQIVRKDSGEEVDKESRRKALPLNKQSAVILQPEDLAELEPPSSRDIEVLSVVPASVLTDQWYERPYYVGPDEEDDESYFALAEALARKQAVGIARWVMRKQRYVGALGAVDGYLTLTTLRRADQVLSFSGIEAAGASAPQASELKLAEQLVASITGAFEPELFENAYRQRVRELIAAKARGEKIKPLPRKSKPKDADLGDALKASLAAMRDKKVA